jgi:hypothetical protein
MVRVLVLAVWRATGVLASPAFAAASAAKPALVGACGRLKL